MACIIPISDTETCPNHPIGDGLVCAEHAYTLSPDTPGYEEMWNAIWDRKRETELSQFNMISYGSTRISLNSNLHHVDGDDQTPNPIFQRTQS